NKMTRRTLESLILAGACDDFGVDRASLLATLDDAIEFGEQEKARGNQIHFTNVEEKNLAYVEVPPLSERERLAYEKETLGYYLSSHPLERYIILVRRLGVLPIIELKSSRTTGSVRAVGIIDSIRMIKTKKAESMAFLQMSD